MLVADIPNQSLTDDAPLYHRPVGVWKRPAPARAFRRRSQAKLAEDRDFTADLKKLLASANVCSKRWVHEQYDTMVQTNTVHRPRRRRRRDAHQRHRRRAGTTERGLAMALDGNGRWAYLDPKLGAMHAVAEAARKVAMTGATPVAATNCLNFGNPEKPEIMAQLSAAIDGIAEACTALGTPITGGNVSLYNETRGEGIYPTPVLGIVGILDDVTKAVPAHFQRAGDAILLLWPIPAGEGTRSRPQGSLPSRADEANASLTPVLGDDSGSVPKTPRKTDAAAAPNWPSSAPRSTPKSFSAASGASRRRSISTPKPICTICWPCSPSASCIHSARDISDGGIAVALAQAAFPQGIGATVEQDQSLMAHPLFGLFAEPASTLLVTADPNRIAEIEELAGKYSFFVRPHRHHRRRIAWRSPSTASPSSPPRSQSFASPGPRPWKPLSTARLLHDPAASTRASKANSTRHRPFRAQHCAVHLRSR